MEAAILAIGNELLNGDIIDTNSNYIQKELRKNNINVSEVRIIKDNLVEISNTIVELKKKYELVFITGGLGPTEDDLTRQAVANAFEYKLEKNENELKRIKNIFNSRNRTFFSNNEKQVYFPEQSIILENKLGTASGFITKDKSQDGKSSVIVMPGVPIEIKYIWEYHIRDYLSDNYQNEKLLPRILFKMYDSSESLIDQKIIKSKILPDNSEYAITASPKGIFVKIEIKKTDDYDSLKTKLIKDFKKLFGDHIYSFSELELTDIIPNILKANNFTISTAESCTGGLISSMFTELSGSSSYYTGSAITYSNENKIKLLGVSEKNLEKYGAVSKETAVEMLNGCQRLFNTDISIAVTGIAGPDGGTKDKPVGTVYTGISFRGKNWVEHNLFHGTRNIVRQRTVYKSLYMIYLMGQKENWILK